MCAWPMLVASRIRRPAGRGQRATVPSPRPALRAGGAHRRCFRRDVHQGDCALRPAAPVRTPPPPIPFFQCPRPSWSATPTVLAACRAFPAAPRRVINCLVDAARGPRADTVPRAIALARVIKAAHALGRRRGSPRLAGPGREQLFSHNRAPNAAVTRTRGRVLHRCPRLHAAPSARSFTEERMFGAIRPGVS